MTCPAPSADAPLVSSLADYLECHASALGQKGFEGAANGFFMMAMLTGCLTIYVALIGYRLVLGQPYTVREAVLACVRVGLVVTFCTRWPSYEAVFYRTVIDGPRELASQMLQSSGLPLLSSSDMAARLQEEYEAIQIAAIKQPAPPPPSSAPQGPGVALPQTSTAVQPPPTAAPATRGFSPAGLVFLTSTIGSLLAVRLAAALLMAIGPLVLLLALFDSLIGLLENWVAALAGTMLATAGIMIVAELELDFVESRLSQFNANGGPALTDQGLMLTAVLFSLCMLSVVVAAGWVGRRLKFRRFWRHSYNGEAQPVRSHEAPVVSAQVRRSGPGVAPTARAAVVANAVSLAGRRERMQFGAPTSAMSSSSVPQPASSNSPVEDAGSISTGLGYSLRRPASPSRSISYARRGQRQ